MNIFVKIQKINSSENLRHFRALKAMILLRKLSQCSAPTNCYKLYTILTDEALGILLNREESTSQYIRQPKEHTVQSTNRIL